MTLPVESISLHLYDEDAEEEQFGGKGFGSFNVNKLKRPRSPVGIFESSRCISEEELSEEGSTSSDFSPRSSFSYKRSRSAEDFSVILGEDSHAGSSVNAFDDEELSTSELASNGFAFTSSDGVSEELSAKRRKKLSLLVPYPRIPRLAEYQCSVCSQAYSRTVADNPWWAVYRHECPSCHSVQVPRIDITKEENAIESDPNVLALYGEGVDDSADEADDEDEPEDNSSLSSEEKDVDDLDSPFSLCSGSSLDGDSQLSSEDASKLLVLICHAKSCGGVHASAKHAEVCRTTKCVMLHVRDCLDKDCNYSWCGSCKLLLQHISSCQNAFQCRLCTPRSLPESLQQLHNINQVRSRA